MANLPETPDYPAGVYQLETSDPVLGGAGGIANRQAEQLGNRTAWLKAKIDAFLDGTVAVLKATKLATARTLSISGAGSGSASFDGSANANIVLTLADSGAVAGTYPKVTVNAKGVVTAGAPLVAADIPTNLALTGNPSAPTPAPFDNDSSLATTEFVQRALGNMRGWTAINANTVLTTSAVGTLVGYTAGSAYTVTLPAASGLIPGASISFYNNTAVDQLVAAAGADTIAFGSTSHGGSVSANFTIPAGCTATFTCISAAAWHLMDGTAALRGTNQPTPAQFDASQKLATMEAVQRALGNYQACAVLTSAVTLTAADAGKAYSLNGGASVVLPLFAAVRNGASFLFFNADASDKTISRQGGDQLYAMDASGSNVSTATSITLKSGEWVIVSANAQWQAMAGSFWNKAKNGPFAFTAGANASQRLPSGMIIKKGVVSSASFPHALTFPVAFPNECQCVLVQGWSLALGHSGRGQGGATVNLQPGQSGSSGYDWIAIGS